MDLNTLMSQMEDMKAQLSTLRQKESELQQQIALTASQDHKDKLESRPHHISCMLSKREYAKLLEILQSYKNIIGVNVEGKASMSSFQRILVLNFMENWRTMPMEDLWRAEIELRTYRSRYSHIGRKQRKL